MSERTLKEAMTKVTYTQEIHTCGAIDDDATLDVRVEDSGNSCYIVVNVHEWAMDNEAEVDAFAEKIKAMLPKEDE